MDTAALGGVLPSSPAQFMPAGQSLHIMGVHRMGESNDGTSVTDPYSNTEPYGEGWFFKIKPMNLDGCMDAAAYCRTYRCLRQYAVDNSPSGLLFFRSVTADRALSVA